MEEVNLLKKLHDTYKKNCGICHEAKHITKFKRKGRFFRTCNSCHIRIHPDKKVNEIFNKALGMMGKENA